MVFKPCVLGSGGPDPGDRSWQEWAGPLEVSAVLIQGGAGRRELSTVPHHS